MEPTSTPRVGWAATRSDGSRSSSRPTTNFCWLPPESDAAVAVGSGGRELERDPSLVVAAHPTRGVDVGSIEFIHDRLLSLRDEQVCTLLVSSKLEEVRTLSDRLAVIHEGEFVDTVDPDAVTEEQLGLLLAGERPDDVSSTAAVTATRTGGDGDR